MVIIVMMNNYLQIIRTETNQLAGASELTPLLYTRSHLNKSHTVKHSMIMRIITNTVTWCLKMLQICAGDHQPRKLTISTSGTATLISIKSNQVVTRNKSITSIPCIRIICRTLTKVVIRTTSRISKVKQS